MLKPDKTALVIVDVQGKLAQLMYEKEALFQNLRTIIRGMQAFNIPIIWSEQKPESLGPTVAEIAGLLTGMEPITKSSFSCCRNEPFKRTLKALDRHQVLLVGIETHVCVYQTALDLVELGYGVEVVCDAVSSRTGQDKEVALQKMREHGVGQTTTEMALFELLESAEAEQFKEILRIVK